MNLPLVSIVVPAYNHARYLGECVESVLAQSYPAVELIVLDDGSSDGTRALLESYGQRFRWESQSNMGQSATLNRGWSMSSGDILGYLSADDMLRPEAVADAVTALAAWPEIVATYPDFDIIDADSMFVRRVTSPDFDRRKLLLDLVCQPGPGAFFRRGVWDKAGPWNRNLRQNPDLDFWLRLALYGDFLRIPKVLAAFRIHEASQTYRRADPARAEEPMIIAAEFLGRGDLPDWVRHQAAHVRASAFLATAQLHLHAGRPACAAKAAVSALQQYPARVFSMRTARMAASAVMGRLAYRIRAALATRQGR